MYLGEETPLDPSIFRGAPFVFLGITIGDDDEMPLVEIGTVPFAGYAHFSGEAGAVTAEAIQGAVDDGHLSGVAASGDYGDLVNPPVLYSDLEAQAVADAIVASHAATSDAHHARYSDAEAEAVADTQIASHTSNASAHHARYTDSEAQAAAAGPLSTHAADASAHHTRYTDSEAAAAASPQLSSHAADPSAHHTRYTDSEAAAAAAPQLAAHTADSSVHHARYTDAEAISAVESGAVTLAAGSTLNGDSISTGSHTVDTLESLGCSDGDRVTYSATNGWQCETPNAPSTFECIPTTWMDNYSTTTTICTTSISLASSSVVQASVNGQVLTSSGCAIGLRINSEPSYTIGDPSTNGMGAYAETSSGSAWLPLSLSRSLLLPAGTHTIAYEVIPRFGYCTVSGTGMWGTIIPTR